jgi:TusA-related sulfurtransferase
LIQKADTILDLSEMMLPLALLKVTDAFRRLNDGGLLEILTRDQETRDGLFKVLPASCYELIEISQLESVRRILLKKTSTKKNLMEN